MRKVIKYLLAGVCGYLLGWSYATVLDERMKRERSTYVTDPAARNAWAGLCAIIGVVGVATWPFMRALVRFIGLHRKLAVITAAIGMSAVWLKFNQLMGAVNDTHELLSTSSMAESPSLRRRAAVPQPVGVLDLRR